MALKRTPLNKEWLNLKSHWRSSKTGANLMGQDSKFFLYVKHEGHLFALHITNLEWHRHLLPFGAEMCIFVSPSLSSGFLKAYEREHLRFQQNYFLFCCLMISIICDIIKHHFFFSFNDDCLNYWVLKAVYNRFVAHRFRVWLFNNPTPRHHYFPIWNMCRYFQTQSLALRAKYNISHVSFILNAPVEAINNTCHCTEKIPFEIGIFFFYSDDQ